MSKTNPFFLRMVFLWLAWANLCGIGVIALGAGFALVQAVSGDNAVIIASDQREPTLTVSYMGQFRYVYDLDRKESCPGEIVTVYRSLDNEGAPAMITLRRPAYLMDVKNHPNVRVTNDLPASVKPGKWNVAASMVSHCANRIQTDPISQFDIEVTP